MKKTDTVRRSAGVALLAALLSAGCSQGTASTPQAAPEKPRVEVELSRTTLTDEHCKSLGVKSVPVTIIEVQPHLKLHGWVMAMPGQEFVITAPVAGYVRLPEKPEDFPVPGQAVRAGQTVCTLEPVLSPVEQTNLQIALIQLHSLRRGIEGEVVKAREGVIAANSEYKRVEELVKSKLRGDQDLEQATARLRYAQEDQKVAEDKLNLFKARVSELGMDPTRPIPLTAPRAGAVLAVHVTHGQYVPAAAPLATIADLSRPWLRVPVAEQDLHRIDRDPKKDIDVLLDGGARRLKFSPKGLVPLVDPAKHTAELLYELAPSRDKDAKGKDPVLAKDLMLAALIPVGAGRNRETVVPPSAILFDSYGGSWVYLEVGAGSAGHVFERRRVEVGPNVAEGFVVRPGLNANDRLVTEGAAALFSREFFKPPMPSAGK